MRDESEAPIRAARHRAGFAAPCQERTFALFLAECLDLSPALVHESLAVLELHLTCRPSCSSVETRRGPARRAVDASARLERQRGWDARKWVAASPFLARGSPTPKAQDRFAAHQNVVRPRGRAAAMKPCIWRPYRGRTSQLACAAARVIVATAASRASAVGVVTVRRPVNSTSV